jgi:hypothetical protein
MSLPDKNDLGVELVLALMASASTGAIDPLDWWVRARTALETAADCADTFSHLISKMGDKLQIPALTGKSSRRVADLRIAVEQVGFEEFRVHVRRDALFITAMAKAKRDEQRAARQKPAAIRRDP